MSQATMDKEAFSDVRFKRWLKDGMWRTYRKENPDWVLVNQALVLQTYTCLLLLACSPIYCNGNTSWSKSMYTCLWGSGPVVHLLVIAVLGSCRVKGFSASEDSEILVIQMLQYLAHFGEWGQLISLTSLCNVSNSLTKHVFIYHCTFTIFWEEETVLLVRTWLFWHVFSVISITALLPESLNQGDGREAWF